MSPRTLFEKIWDAHVVSQVPGGPDLLYVDLHLVHEVTSPQAFEGLRLAGRKVRRPDLTVATVDHNVPKGATRDAVTRAWQDLHSDSGALYDRSVFLDASTLGPQVTWGTSPGMTADITE